MKLLLITKKEKQGRALQKTVEEFLNFIQLYCEEIAVVAAMRTKYWAEKHSKNFIYIYH